MTEKEFSKLIRTNILGEFTDKEGYISMYFNQKQLREIGTFLDIRFKDLKEMRMQQIKEIIKL